MSKENIKALTLAVKDLKRRVKLLEQEKTRKKIWHPVKILRDLDEDLIDIIQTVTCKIWKVTLEQLFSKCRGAHLVNARRSAAHLAYKDYGLGNTVEIGNRFGGRNHSTISYEVKSADNLLESKDADFCESHYRAKAILDRRFESLMKNEHPIDFQI